MNYPAIPREFFNGDCFDAYRILGAHPCTAPDGAEGWRFAVWAPGATAVEVCGGFDGWEAGVPMERAETGVWSAFIPGLAEGDLYKYRVHGADGSVVMRSDPYAFSTELRPGTASRLAKLDFAFDDHAWMERRDKCRNRPQHLRAARRELEAQTRQHPARRLGRLVQLRGAGQGADSLAAGPSLYPCGAAAAGRASL